MKKISFLLIIYLMFGCLAWAQDYKGKGRVQGIVTDEQGKPIAGVKVILFSVRASQGFSTVTDSQGVWNANWIRNGQWNVDFEKIGYAPKKISMQISEQKRNPDIEVALKKVEGLIVSEDLETELSRGNELFDQEKYDEARAVYEKMLADNPEAYIVNLNIGNCCFQQEKYEDAVAFYQKILESDASNVNAILGIGNCYANGGDNDKALEWYSKIELNKIDDVTVLYNIGTNYYNLGQSDEALKYYMRSVEVQADFLDGIYQLGLVNLTLDNKAEAIAHFENYLENDSESQRAEQVRGFLEYLKK